MQKNKFMSNKKAKSSHQFYPMALTIAGSDSGGGAGMQADLRTFNAFGVFGTSVITAVTSQNPRQLCGIEKMSADCVRKQLDSVFSCYAPAFVKTGMLADVQQIQLVADAVKKYDVNLVCDPVLMTGCNADMLKMYCSKLFPVAAWITPNVAEAELILGDNCRITGEKELFAAARKLHERFGVSVLLKGGHLDLPESVDAVCRGGKIYRLSSPEAEVMPFARHGVGCTLSAALTAGLVLDYPWKQALCEAKSFVLGSLTQNVELASGVFGMYPPTEDCYDLIKLEAVGD